MTAPFQPSLGESIQTDAPAGPAHPPILWEPPWPLVERPELWVLQTGSPTWGGAQVFLSDDDDDYDTHGAMVSSLMTTGTLLDPIPSAPAEGLFEPVTFRIQFHVPRDFPACTVADAIARRSDLLIGSPIPEVVAPTQTRLLATDDGGCPTYECSGPLVRSGYGTGRASDWSLVGHEAGTPVGRLCRNVCRIALAPRQVGRTLWLKLTAQNEYADPDGMDEPARTEPIAHAVQGLFYQRDPRRFL